MSYIYNHPNIRVDDLSGLLESNSEALAHLCSAAAMPRFAIVFRVWRLAPKYYLPPKKESKKGKQKSPGSRGNSVARRHGLKLSLIQWWWFLLLSLLVKSCSYCVWNSLVFSCLGSHGEWRCLRCLSFCRCWHVTAILTGKPLSVWCWFQGRADVHPVSPCPRVYTLTTYFALAAISRFSIFCSITSPQIRFTGTFSDLANLWYLCVHYLHSPWIVTCSACAAWTDIQGLFVVCILQIDCQQ